MVVKNLMVVEKRIHRTEETVKRKTNASFLVQFCVWGGLEYLPLFARISSRGVSVCVNVSTSTTLDGRRCIAPQRKWEPWYALQAELNG